MDWYPLWNSLRIAVLSIIVVFFLGILLAYYVAKLPRIVKGFWMWCLPCLSCSPPTVCGWLLLLVFGLKHPSEFFLQSLELQFVMTWYGGVLAASVVAFPLMYRTARGAFEKALTKRSNGAEKRWGFQTPMFSGAFGCRHAGREFWQGQYWPLPALSAEYGATSMLIEVYARKNRYNIYNGISAVENERRQGRQAWVLINLAISAVVASWR